MKGQSLGRQELLQWLNDFTECDYPKIELLSDSIGYAQIIDAVHPGYVNLTKFNLMARYPEDFLKNLKCLDEIFTKLRIEKAVPIDKLGKGKFQDNMNFLQWLFNYASKLGPFALKTYKGYQRRLDAFEKQSHGRYAQMSAHLIPNREFLKFKQYSSNDEYQDIQQEIVELPQQDQIQKDNKFRQLESTLKDLEQDMKNKMEYNWKLIYALDDMLYQRDVLYNILAQIDQSVLKAGEKNQISEKILNIISEQPDDFTIVK